jgi:1-acyl-sn-glycerol-3-phosphate acyltransferase
MARRLDVIFIDRSKRSDALSVGREITLRLKQGRNVCLFPEGTSTDGREVQRFHPALFQSVVDANVNIQPIAIRYFRASGALATEAAFTGTMSLAQSMWHLAGATPIVIDITYLPPIDSSGLDRRTLANEARAVIERRLREPVSGWQPTASHEMQSDYARNVIARL